MSLIINIPDLDDSASLLPVLNETVAGFPVTNMQALYLFEDGAIDSIPTQALDSSGLGNHAPLAAGSSVKRTATGVSGIVSGPGFVFRTPVPLKTSTSFIVAVRDDRALDAVLTYPVVHAKSRSLTSDGTTAAGNHGLQNRATDGSLFLNTASGPSASPLPNYQVFTQKSGAAQGLGPFANAIGNGASVSAPANTPRASFTVVGVSINAVTGLIILRAFGLTVQFTSLDDLTIWLAGDGVHTFGMLQYNGQNGALGSIGLNAIYSGAKTVAELDALIATAKTRMALRGVAAL